MKPGSEDHLQVTVAVMLSKLLPKDAVFWHTPNGGSRHMHEAVKLKSMGVKPGIPDIFIYWKTQLYAIELKAAKGRVSPEQTDMLDKLWSQGCEFKVCRSKDDVRDACTLWGIPLVDRILSVVEAKELL